MRSRWGGEPLPMWAEALLGIFCVFVLWLLVVGP